MFSAAPDRDVLGEHEAWGLIILSVRGRWHPRRNPISPRSPRECGQKESGAAGNTALKPSYQLDQEQDAELSACLNLIQSTCELSWGHWQIRKEKKKTVSYSHCQKRVRQISTCLLLHSFPFSLWEVFVYTIVVIS